MNKKLHWYHWLLMALAVLLAVVVAVVLMANNADIPKLYFQGNISGMEDKSDVRDISVRYVNGKQTVQGYAELKVQGTSSLYYEKKNYTIKFYADDAHDQKLKLDVGWGEQSKYCLKANWIDRTHARNVVTARLVSQVQEKYGVLTQAPRNGAVDGFPVEIYSNGKFLGLYTFNIPKDAWQFAMDEDNPDHIVVCGENWEDAALFRAMPNFDSWSVEVGEESGETLEKLNRLFDFVINSSDEEFTSQFEEYLNLDATLNYYVLVDFAHMSDNLGKNMLLATYDGKIWYPSLYDLDTTWGTTYDGMGLQDYENNPGTGMSWSFLFERMEQCFPRELGQRYFELRQDLLSKEHIMAEFEDFRRDIPEIVFIKEGLRWGEGLVRRREDLPGYEYDQIEAYLDTVSSAFDEKYQWLLES